MRNAAAAPECVVPAAGRSSRMGGLKQVMRLDGVPLVRRVTEAALTVCTRCIVVTGYRAEEVGEAVSDLPNVTIVHNAAFDRGMLSSIARGAREVVAQWFFVAPADMPFLDAAVFRYVWHAGRSALEAARDGSSATDSGTGPLACFPVVGERPAHPVLISRAVVPDLIARREQSDSMRSFLAAYPTLRLDVPFEPATVDVDTPEAWRQALERDEEPPDGLHHG